MAIMVENKNGVMVDFEIAVEFMDDVIREGIANDGTSYSEQGFFTAYENAHSIIYGEDDWEFSKPNPIY